MKTLQGLKRGVIGLAAAWFGLMAAQTATAAEPFPTRPITIYLPYATGGSADLLARLAAKSIQEGLGQTVVVEAKPGAGGQIATEQVARAAPDGYTLLLTASGTMGVNPYVYKLRYRPVEDFAQVSVLVDLPFVVVVRPDFPSKSLSEFIANAKAHPKTLTFGNAGFGTQQHLTQLMFMKAAGIDLNLVPYKGSVPALNDLLGGHIDAMLDNTGVQTPFIQGKKTRALFITSRERMGVIGEVPTAEEAGLPGFSAVAWFGLAAPAGTPASIVQAINKAIADGFAKPENHKILVDLGMVPLASSPEEASRRVVSDLALFGAVAQEIGLKPE